MQTQEKEITRICKHKRNRLLEYKTQEKEITTIYKHNREREITRIYRIYRGRRKITDLKYLVYFAHNS